MIAVANSFEARVRLDRASASVQLPAPARTIELFEKEYFVRVSGNGEFIEGLHAIRSSVLVDELVDPVLNPWSSLASTCVSCIADEDLETFLLTAFIRRPEATGDPITALQEFEPTTWTGICGISRALTWLGLRHYVDENSQLIRECQRVHRSSWYIMLDFDVGLAQGEKGFDLFAGLGHEFEIAARQSQELRNRQTDKRRVFDELRRWLSTRSSPPSNPTSVTDLLAMAEVLFWIGRLHIESPASEWFAKDQFSAMLQRLPIEHLGEFVSGVRECHSDWYAMWLSDNRDWLFELIRGDGAFTKFEDDDDLFLGRFIIDLDRNASTLRRSDLAESASATFHEITIERVELLSSLFAGKPRYGAVGYGHRNCLMPTRFDDADKFGVLADALLPTWLHA